MFLQIFTRVGRQSQSGRAAMPSTAPSIFRDVRFFGTLRTGQSRAPARTAFPFSASALGRSKGFPGVFVAPSPLFQSALIQRPGRTLDQRGLNVQAARRSHAGGQAPSLLAKSFLAKSVLGAAAPLPAPLLHRRSFATLVGSTGTRTRKAKPKRRHAKRVAGRIADRRALSGAPRRRAERPRVGRPSPPERPRVGRPSPLAPSPPRVGRPYRPDATLFPAGTVKRGQDKKKCLLREELGQIKLSGNTCTPVPQEWPNLSAVAHRRYLVRQEESLRHNGRLPR